MNQDSKANSELPIEHRVPSDWPFYLGMSLLASVYIVLLLGMIIADFTYTTPVKILDALRDDKIQYSIRLSLLSCTITTILSLWVAVPLGYLMSRHEFPGKSFLDSLMDIPIVLPPLVIGISLLILFSSRVGTGIENMVENVTEYLSGLTGLDLKTRISYEVPAVILAQFAVACAFAVRTMKSTFDQLPPRREQVALTLGCSRSQAFWGVVLPDAKKGVLTAATLAWARSMGEFGPILIFAGTTRLKTEVMPSTVFLEFNVGRLDAALAVSMIMILSAFTVLFIIRRFGRENSFERV